MKHGETANGIISPEYNAWDGMKKRCYDERNKAYHNYGARGIKVCDRWIESFDNFLSDMGRRPSSKHSIERKNVNGNYSPDNCIWANSTEQNINRRIPKNNTTGVKGIYFNNSKKKWQAKISIDNKEKHLGWHKDFEGAVNARKEAELKYWGKSS